MDLDLARITKALGLEPVSAQPSADLGIPGKRMYNTRLGHWNLASRLRRNATVQNHVKDILEQNQTEERNPPMDIEKHARRSQYTIAGGLIFGDGFLRGPAGEGIGPAFVMLDL